MKIQLKAAIAFMNTGEVNGGLNVFKLEFRKMNGEYCVKNHVCKANLDDLERQVRQLTDKSANKIEKTKGLYSVIENRIIRLYDMEKKQNFSIKIDLICKVNDNIIDHLPY